MADLTVTPLFFGRYTVQFKADTPPDTSDDDGVFVPEELESLYLKRLGFEEGVPVADKGIDELYAEGVLHSYSIVQLDTIVTDASLSADNVSYTPSNDPGQRIEFGVNANNENQSNPCTHLISINFSHSIDR